MEKFKLMGCIKHPLIMLEITEFNFKPSDVLIEHCIHEYMKDTTYIIKSWSLIKKMESYENIKVHYNEI